MRYQRKSSIAYMFRNFWQLIYVTLPVSILMAFFINPSKEVEFFQSLIANDGTITRENLLEAYSNAITVLRLGEYWWLGVIAMFVFVYTVSLMIVKIDRHMRIGEMSALPLKRAFKVFPSVLLLSVCGFVISEIVNLLSVGVMYLMGAVQNVWIVTAVGVALLLVIRLLVAWVFMLTILAYPLKFSENYHLNVALSYSARIMFKKKAIVWGLGCAYVAGRCLVLALAYVIPYHYADVAVYAIAYVLVFTYLPCLAYKMYHDSVGGERRDISQIMFD